MGAINDSLAIGYFIHVVDTPFAAKTDASGRVIIRGLPGGSHPVHVWHSQLRAPANQLTLNVDAARTPTLNVPVRLRLAAPMHHDY